MIRLFKRYYPVRNVFFVLGEGMIIYISLTLTGIWMTRWGWGGDALHQYLLMTLICQVCLYYGGLYDLGGEMGFRELLGRLIQAMGAVVIILSSIHLWLGREVFSGRVFVSSLMIIMALVVSWRLLYALSLNLHLFDKTVLVLGESPLIRSVLQEASQRKDSGYHLIHAVPGRGVDHSRWSYAASFDTMEENHHGLLSLARKLDARLIVSDKVKEGCTDNVEEALLECRLDGIRVLDAQSFFEMITGKLHTSQVTTCWLVFSEGFHRPLLNQAIKLILDKVISLGLLALFAPLMGGVAILIKLDSRGPVFYSQQRLGKNKKSYCIHKFRSMVQDAEFGAGPQWSTAQDPRVTRLGAFLRNYRIDELPQLWNVLKGDMSLVGPRPEREHFVKRLESTITYYGTRFTVKPGITGWAQVNYGYGASANDAFEKLNYDLFYIKNSSVFMDLFILFKTTRTVILGVEQAGSGQPEMG